MEKGPGSQFLPISWGWKMRAKLGSRGSVKRVFLSPSVWPSYMQTNFTYLPPVTENSLPLSHPFLVGLL